jgi:transcriptional regulator with XRE-family HTH domain
MAKTRVKNIDAAMCRRIQVAFKRLGMTYKAIAADAGIPSKAQLIEISNGLMEPSKRVLRYLCSKGFSAHWLFTGEGPELWMGKTGSPANSSVITKQLKTDISTLSDTLDACIDQVARLRATLQSIQGSRPGKRP